MTCEDVSRDEIVERYLVDQLSDDARDAFEQHYFECAGCFSLLQKYRDLQAELARTRDSVLPAATRQRWVWRWAWAPAIAVVFVAVSVAVWQRPLGEVDTHPGQQTESSTPARPSTPEVSSASAKPTLADLARVEAPRYLPRRLRGAADPAIEQFERAMEHYQRGDYGTAVTGLRAASALDREAPHVTFFLGISHLMAAEPDNAVLELRKTIALGDSPYLEGAHFYLAKAHLRKGNVSEGIRELERTIALRGEHERDARKIVTALAAFGPPR